MEIIQAKSSDLVEILYLIKVCIRDMDSKSLRHWNSSFPETAQIQNDLQNGSIYLVKDNWVCKGMIILNNSEPEDYRQMKIYSDGSKPMFIHCIAVHPTWQGKGIARLLIDFAQKVAKDSGFNCIRLDIYQTSELAVQLCEKLSFKEIGTFQTNYQRIPYVCYEKQL